MELQTSTPRHLQQTELQVGDQTIYNGHLYWVTMRITHSDGEGTFALRQAHWPPGHVIHAKKADVMPDVPYTA